MNTVNVTAPLLVLLTTTLLHFVPLWRREQLWFGVTVPVGFDKTPDGRRVLRGYRIVIWLVAAAVVALTASIGAAWGVRAGCAVVAVAAFVAFARGRRQTAPFGVQRPGSRSAPLDDVPEKWPGGWMSVLGPFVMISATAVYLWSHWAQLPKRVPMHFDLAGVADRWVDRTPESVGQPLVAAAVLVVVLFALGVAILRTSPRSRAGVADAWTRRFRHANLRLLVVSVWSVTALLCGSRLLLLGQVDDHLPSLFWILSVAALGAIVLCSVPLIRLSSERHSGSDGTPDECWKLGQIYINPADPALMVEKRFGVGYTINLGNPIAWVTLMILLVVACVAKWL